MRHLLLVLLFVGGSVGAEVPRLTTRSRERVIVSSAMIMAFTICFMLHQYSRAKVVRVI